MPGLKEFSNGTVPVGGGCGAVGLAVLLFSLINRPADLGTASDSASGRGASAAEPTAGRQVRAGVLPLGATALARESACPRCARWRKGSPRSGPIPAGHLP